MRWCRVGLNPVDHRKREINVSIKEIFRRESRLVAINKATSARGTSYSSGHLLLAGLGARRVHREFAMRAVHAPRDNRTPHETNRRNVCTRFSLTYE